MASCLHGASPSVRFALRCGASWALPRVTTPVGACSAGISQRRTSTYRSNMAAQGLAWFELCIALLRSLVTHYFAHATCPRVLAANAILQTGTNAQKISLVA